MHYVITCCGQTTDFNLPVSTLTAKLPNLIPSQIYCLYGSHVSLPQTLVGLPVILWQIQHLNMVPCMKSCLCVCDMYRQKGGGRGGKEEEGEKGKEKRGRGEGKEGREEGERGESRWERGESREREEVGRRIIINKGEKWWTKEWPMSWSHTSNQQYVLHWMRSGDEAENGQRWPKANRKPANRWNHGNTVSFGTYNSC